MNFSLWMRNNVTDRANAPLRRELVSLVPAGARVLEVGCANGRLLLDLAPSIELGLGIDLDAPMIAHAQRTAARAGHAHLRFAVADARRLAEVITFKPTVAVASLCLHEMEQATAATVLRQLGEVADRVVIADFIEPRSRWQRAFLHFDERLSGHYHRYQAYRASGGMPALLARTSLTIRDERDTKLPAVRVWVCGIRRAEEDCRRPLDQHVPESLSEEVRHP